MTAARRPRRAAATATFVGLPPTDFANVSTSANPHALLAGVEVDAHTSDGDQLEAQGELIFADIGAARQPAGEMEPFRAALSPPVTVRCHRGRTPHRLRAGALGAVGRELIPAITAADDLSLQSAVARRELGRDIGEALGGDRLGVAIGGHIEAALDRRPDVLIDYTHPVVIRRHVALALERRVPVVIGTTGLFDEDFAAIDAAARAAGVGVATGNFSPTAALLQHLGRIAARYVARFEVIEQGPAEKPDVPSGTARELAQASRASAARRPAPRSS